MADAKRRDMRLTPTTAKELREEARPTFTSIERARDEWRSVAPRELRNLPDAVEE